MRFFLGISLGAIICFAVLEASLRFLPVISGARMEATSIDKPFSRYLPHQHYVYSFGWSIENARYGVTNSQGFTHSPDSSEEGGVIVIGDSYIESLMLDFPETVQGHLHEHFPGKVQAISASGNGLADSLQIVKYFAPHIRPSVVVFFVEPFDLSELLAKPSPGHNGFVVSDDTGVSVTHSAYAESPNKQIVLQSALARYIYYNLKLPDWVSKALVSARSNTKVKSKNDLSTNELVLNYYFSQLRLLSDSDNFRVVFLLDGDRKAIYSRNVEQAWNPDNRQLFLKLALKHGLDVVDMQPAFKRHWDQTLERMDYLPIDGHWNLVAHKLAADEIINLLNTKENLALLH